MPSLYSGEKYWNSIYTSAKKIGNKNLASDVWYDTADKSTRIIDQVIGVLEPKAIVFTSISAGNAYKNAGEKKGIEVFEEGLNTLVIAGTWNKGGKE